MEFQMLKRNTSPQKLYQTFDSFKCSNRLIHTYASKIWQVVKNDIKIMEFNSCSLQVSIILFVLRSANPEKVLTLTSLTLAHVPVRKEISMQGFHLDGLAQNTQNWCSIFLSLYKVLVVVLGICLAQIFFCFLVTLATQETSYFQCSITHVHRGGHAVLVSLQPQLQSAHSTLQHSPPPLP